jgi:hypothetical protein
MRLKPGRTSTYMHDFGLPDIPPGSLELATEAHAGTPATKYIGEDGGYSVLLHLPPYLAPSLPDAVTPGLFMAASACAEQAKGVCYSNTFSVSTA